MVTQAQSIPNLIYFVDDDEDDRVTFAEVLAEIDNSIPVVLVADGHHLMDLLLSNLNQLPNIIFLDINMPVKNGFECLQEIRDHDSSLSTIKVVILTTSIYPPDLTKANELGASLYAVKPNTLSEWKLLMIDILTME